MDNFELNPIGRVESVLTDLAAAPRQPDEGAPEAWLVFEPAVVEAMSHLGPGMEILLLTWLHRARRDVLSVHPRDDHARPLEGVFTTRSADRPNPSGLHRVKIAEVRGHRVRVRHLEALHGTPIVGVKPVMDDDPQSADPRTRSTDP